MRAPTRASFLPLLLAFVVASPALAATRPPRDEVAAVAGVIEANYFDAGRARRIADDLRAAASRGEFDSLAAPSDLAAALTARLRPLDGHFKVTVPDGLAPTGAGRDPAAGPIRMRSPGPGAPPPDLADDNPVAAVEVLDGNIGYLRLDHFADVAQPEAPARRALDAALHRLADTSALIIDLRGGHGGSPAMVGYLASAFVAPGADVYNVFHSREGSRSEAPSQTHAKPRTEVPLYVLTDSHDRSAAESFAYTLKSAGRATLVGERTEGAANPGREFLAGDGLAVFVSTATPVNPFTHANWEGQGVMPDVAVPAPQALDTALTRIRKAAARATSK